MKRYFIFIFFLLASLSGQAQILEPAIWRHEISKKEVAVGEEIDLVFKVKIQKDWYLYSSDFDPELGPQVTTFTFDANNSYELVGDIQPIGAKTKYDEIWEGDVTYFTKTAEFRQTIKVLKPKLKVSGTYEYQVCSDVSGQCIPFDDEFSFKLKAKGDSTDEEKEGAANAAVKTDKKAGDQDKVNLTKRSGNDPYSLLAFMLLAFGAGLAALLTPCVFPMIPMTVTFFTNQSQSRKQAIVKALVYGVSIVAIYTIVGTIVSRVNGPEFANWLSTHWAPNLFFFAVFVIFALSFLGLFEITLPSSVVNKVDAQADKGGYMGVFFMAFTLVLVSFSCTGPIVGSILVESAGGQVLKPIVGMFGFSMAFALPFTMFAIFPEWLNNLPKSGGWLNAVKVVLGLLELALGLKFLSIADQVYHWGILDREVYLAIWIVIFTVLGFYLLGKIRLPHDSKTESVSVPRLIMAIATFAFVIYLIPGMWGAPLKGLAGYLPPMSTHDFNVEAMIRQNGGGGNIHQVSEICEEPKYADIPLHLPHGLEGYFDYDQALACAKKQNKPLFIDFTGHGCVNCREMEANVWSDPKVLKRLKEDYIVVALYVDEKTKLPESEWYTSSFDGKVKKTIGKQNADFQISKFQNNAQPFYVLMSPEGQPLVDPKAYDLDVNNFVKFLDKGLENFKKERLAAK